MTEMTLKMLRCCFSQLGDHNVQRYECSSVANHSGAKFWSISSRCLTITGQLNIQWSHQPSAWVQILTYFPISKIHNFQGLHNCEASGSSQLSTLNTKLSSEGDSNTTVKRWYLDAGPVQRCPNVSKDRLLAIQNGDEVRCHYNAIHTLYSKATHKYSYHMLP